MQNKVGKYCPFILENAVPQVGKYCPCLLENKGCPYLLENTVPLCQVYRSEPGSGVPYHLAKVC